MLLMAVDMLEEPASRVEFIFSRGAVEVAKIEKEEKGRMGD